jgi:predicted nucleic acid-binding protein
LLAINKPARLYVSAAIVAEYSAVLARPELKIRKGLRQQLLDLVKNQAQIVKPARALQITKDPDDDKFLECADAAPRRLSRDGKPTSREFIDIVAPHLIT